MLCESDAIRLLIERGLISPTAVHAHDVMLEPATSRNVNYKVFVRNRSSFFVKQSPTAFDVGVEREFRVLRRLRSIRAMQPHVPRVHFYDSKRRVLVTELLRSHANLKDPSLRTARIAQRAASALGAMLAKLHRFGRIGAGRHIASAAPWVFALHRLPVANWRTLSQGQLLLIETLQRMPAVCEVLDALGAQWRPLGVVHNDIKLVNVMARPGRATPRLTVVDWEMSGDGDPAWDVGAALAAYLDVWVASIPVVANEVTTTAVPLAGSPLDAVLRCIHALRSSYAPAVPRADAGAFWARSVRYAGARLVQNAFEYVQASSETTALAALLLQLGANVLLRPVEAAVRLMRFPADARA